MQDSRIIKGINDSRHYVVYMHTAPNKKRYIGITGQNPPEKRWANGHGYIYNEYFNKDIIFYGWNNFKHEILFDNLTKLEARKKEIELISHYDSANKNFGYNVRAGDTEKILSEVEIKMSRHSGSKSAMPVTQYTCLGEFIKTFDSIQLAEIETGIFRTNIIKCCEEILQSAGNFVWRYADSNFNLINYNYKINKQIIQYTKNGIFIRKYNSIISASKENNVDQSSITKCCKHKVQSAGGYIWRYASDIEDPCLPLFSSLPKAI